jgi:hypothetical protein
MTRGLFALAFCGLSAAACGQGDPSELQDLGSSVSSALAASRREARVLQVGSHRGRQGAFDSIQAAVDAAKPGDWVLIGEGDYKERGAPDAGVLVTTPGLHLRGMSRNRVIVDGTKEGFPACSADPAAQDAGPAGGGRNGIEVFEADGVTIENLTACNFPGGASGSNGNQIWWNGGDGSGQIGMGSYRGAYLTASTTAFDPTMSSAAQYGIFVSNARGPGLIERSYASNMADSSFYVGACADCNAVLRRVHAQNSALGYSGTNAGGHLVIEDSEWDSNRVGILPSSLANDDPPSPQDGACPDHPGRSCTLIRGNYVHDNDNPNTPALGLTAGSPVGTGIDLSGGRNNTVRGNLVARNGAWGILINDYPDASLPAVPAWCAGGSPWFNPPPPFDQLLGPVIPCYFQATGNRVEGNVFADNGRFGNDTNGDLANATIASSDTNCFRHNRDLRSWKPTSAPANLQDAAVAGTCGVAWNPDLGQVASLFQQVLCAAFGPASGACTSGPGYPQSTGVTLMPIPHEPGMPDPCAGVPDNSWCDEHDE